MASGHRFIYLKWVTKAFLKAGITPVIATTLNNEDNPILLELIQETPELKVYFFNQPYEVEKFAFREILMWLWFYKAHKIVNNEHPDLEVFLPYLDYILRIIPVLGSPFSESRFSGIVMTQSFHHRHVGVNSPKMTLHAIDDFLFKHAVRHSNLTRVLTIDETLKEYSRDKFEKVGHIPDPVEAPAILEKRQARSLLNLPETKFMILVFGSVSPRKGLNRLLEAVSERELDVCLVIAGRQDAASQALLKQPASQRLMDQGRLWQFNEFINPDDENIIYSAADIAWCGYQNHYIMSGVLIKAASMDTPVISCREGLLGHLTRKYNLGVATDCTSPEKISAAILKLQSDSLHNYSNSMQEFAAGHTVDKFQKLVTHS